CCLVGILSGQGNVLDLRHNCALLCSVLGLMADTTPQPRDSHAILRGARARVNDKYPSKRGKSTCQRQIPKAMCSAVYYNTGYGYYEMTRIHTCHHHFQVWTPTLRAICGPMCITL